MTGDADRQILGRHSEWFGEPVAAGFSRALLMEGITVKDSPLAWRTMTIHVAIFSLPIPALVNPSLSVVETLVRRGYRVTYVTSERFASEVATLGADVLRCPRLDAPFDQDDDGALPIEHQYARDLISLASRTCALTWPFFERNKPDLVIYDSIAFAGILVAEKAGVSAIRMSNQFAYNNETLDTGSIPLEWKHEQLELQRRANEFMAANMSIRSNVILNNRDPTFYCYLRELQLGCLVEGDDVVYAARCTAERPNVAPWRMQRPPTASSALVASSTTYATDPQYYKSCIAALSNLGWETVLSIGSHSRLADFGSLPPNCQPILNVPLIAIMPHVDLIVCAAGMATAMEAGYHGLPMLMLTSGRSELETYADKFQERGMGIHIRQTEASADNVAGCAAWMIQDSELQAAVRRMQATVKRSAGAEELVNWLEQRMPRVPTARR